MNQSQCYECGAVFNDSLWKLHIKLHCDNPSWLEEKIINYRYGYTGWNWDPGTIDIPPPISVEFIYDANRKICCEY